ncbi:MAG: MMPL family transporter, partial [Spirochaetes bacterium]|nr:MMPL family transporter [Spirochaetota bacterium]
FYDKIISRDKKSVIFFLYYPEEYLSKKNIMKDIDHIIDSFSDQNGFNIYLAGMHIIYEELNTKTMQETSKLFIFTLILLILITLILLRNVFDILYILIVNIFSVSIAFSFFSFFNGKLNMVVMLFPILTMILSTSDTIHIINTFKGKIDTTKKNIVTTTIHKAFLPCFLTSLTTLIGFFSLSMSKIGVISDLGIYTSIGIVSSFFSAIIISIIYLSFKKKRFKYKDKTSKLITYYCKFIKKSKIFIIIAVFIILIFSIYFITRLNIDTYSIGMLGKNNRIFKDSQKIENSFGYYLPLEIMINTENNHEDSRIETLYNIEIFQEKLNGIKEIGTTLSIVDVIKELPVFINIQKKSKNVLSKKKIITKSILNVLKKNEYHKNFYNEEYNTYKLTAFIKMGSARHFKTIIQDIDNIAKLIFNNSSVVIPSGAISIYAATIDHFVKSMFKSILFAIVSILIVMFIIFKRPIIFFYVIIVNAIPIIAVLGIMSILKNNIDITALTMIVICCGVVVDDTIHYLYGYRHNIDKNGDTLLSVSQEVIWPIIVTSLVLIAGSISLVFSSLSPIKYSGILMASIVFFALIADILLLPVLLSFLHREAV